MQDVILSQFIISLHRFHEALDEVGSLYCSYHRLFGEIVWRREKEGGNYKVIKDRWSSSLTSTREVQIGNCVDFWQRQLSEEGHQVRLRDRDEREFRLQCSQFIRCQSKQKMRWWMNYTRLLNIRLLYLFLIAAQNCPSRFFVLRMYNVTKEGLSSSAMRTEWSCLTVRADEFVL